MQDIILSSDLYFNLLWIDSLFLRGQGTGENKGQRQMETLRSRTSLGQETGENKVQNRIMPGCMRLVFRS